MAEDPLPLETIARLPDVYHPVASPRGDAIAYYHDGTGRNELYVDALDGTGPTRISDGEVPRNARWWIRWRRDGQGILFHNDEGGDEQNDIWEIDMTGTVTPVVETAGQTHIYDTDSTGDRILYGSDEAEQLNLYRFDRDRSTAVQLTTFDQPVWGGLLSPDDETVAFTANESDDLANRDPYVTAFDGTGEINRLDIGDEGAETHVADWHPAGDRLLIADNSPDTPRAGVYDLATEEVTWYGDPADVESPVAFHPDGDGFIAWRIHEAAYEARYYGLDGTVEPFDLPPGVTAFPNGGHRTAFLADGRAIVLHTTPNRRKDLVLYDPATGSSTVARAADYGGIDPDRFADARYVTYESSDGLEIGGVLYDSGVRPSPAIVHVHGGPHSQSVRRFDQYAQFLVDRGFSVFQPNYRGSTGRGREFKHRIHHDWGGMEAADIHAGGQWLAGQDWIDEDRLLVYGGSYGGYSTFWQLVDNPGFWTAGIAWIGITDLLDLYENSMPHFKTMLEQQLGDPAENEALYRERSPLTHVDRLEDPILIVHGVNDPRCPIEQARAFRDALEARGWVVGEDFAYEELSEEGHGSTDLDQKVRAFRLIEEFIEPWAP